MTPEQQQLVTQNVGLVGWVIGRHFRAWSRRPNFDYDDAGQAGLLGLSVAACRFDPGRGAKFSTFACHLIRAHVQDALSRGDLIRVPPSTYSRALRRGVRHRFRPARLSLMSRRRRGGVAVAPVPDGGPDLGLLEGLLAHLGDRPRLILRLWAEGASLGEIAGRLGASEGAIRQAKSAALARLRSLAEPDA